MDSHALVLIRALIPSFIVDKLTILLLRIMGALPQAAQPQRKVKSN